MTAALFSHRNRSWRLSNDESSLVLTRNQVRLTEQCSRRSRRKKSGREKSFAMVDLLTAAHTDLPCDSLCLCPSLSPNQSRE
ncbi:hypothetical protein DPMN_000490 [Dreissena polymorpha]|uniref:Uncharacterized protein n=1 Tax=Dreissena polymorpha TaxID=45954 RepID=A0A9D4MJU2_DREPO|nr:hypothetical protein DPMN_000490 [Dreissena polymorpha]